MNSKAQAGLEYLMTYGWALVLIVTVAGVLFFVMAPPTESFICRSSDPTKIIIKQYNLPYDSAYSDGTNQLGYGTIFNVFGGSDLQGEMILQNATGGPIIITDESQPTMRGVMPNGGNDYLYLVPNCTKNKKFFGPREINGITMNTLRTALGVVEITKGGEIKADKFVLANDVEDDSPEDPECVLAQSQIPNTHSWGFVYTDQFGYQKEVTITCQGYPSTE